MLSGNNTNVFTPEGRILQMQYATEASKVGATSFGICTDEVLILAAEKRPATPLLVAWGLDKIIKMDNHIYCTISGMSADARSLIGPSRVTCLNHWLQYHEAMPIESLLDMMATQANSFGTGDDDTANNSSSSSSDGNNSSSSDSDEESDDDNKRLLTRSRPYGVAFLLGGLDNDKLQLWHMEPNGEFGQHGIKAIGSGADMAERWLIRHYEPDMDLAGALTLALSTMRVVVGEERLKPAHLDLMVITKDKRFQKLDEKQLEQEIGLRKGKEHWC